MLLKQVLDYGKMALHMNEILTWIFYFLSFMALYVQIYFLVVFLERRKDMLVRRQPIKLKEYPSVTITVPAYNEGLNVKKTVDSLLSLDYPKDKLFLILVIIRL